RRTHHGQQGPKRCLVGNTETMKGMGRASRVNVEQKEVEIARAISEALLRRQTGVRGKSKS
ncbi:MAG: hypothetical protein WB987_00475, partial [Candidatus Acidiferrales bacterium]